MKKDKVIILKAPNGAEIHISTEPDEDALRGTSCWLCGGVKWGYGPYETKEGNYICQDCHEKGFD